MSKKRQARGRPSSEATALLHAGVWQHGRAGATAGGCVTPHVLRDRGAHTQTGVWLSSWELPLGEASSSTPHDTQPHSGSTQRPEGDPQGSFLHQVMKDKQPDAKDSSAQ